MSPQSAKSQPFSIQDIFTPDPNAFVSMGEEAINSFMMPYRFLAQIMGQALREHYGFKDIKVETLPVNKERMMMCISEDEGTSAPPAKFANATGQKIQRFLDDLVTATKAEDIYISINTSGLPVISFKADDMIEALRTMTTLYDNADKYKNALNIATHLGRSNTKCKKGLRLA